MKRILLLAIAVALGAAARIYARSRFGDPGTAGTMPVIIEVLIPIFLIALRYDESRAANKAGRH